tara:strand:- start:155 stop:508 length:354 start_codon:yes stop_codon:yes gene_type:complete
MDNSKFDIGLCSSKKIFETGTSNIFFVKKNKIYSPAKNCYEGITFKFFESKLKKVIKKEIMISSISEYDEIILIGSGKGVASVEKIDKFKWKRKSFKMFNLLNKHYLLATKKNQKYT